MAQSTKEYGLCYQSNKYIANMCNLVGIFICRHKYTLTCLVNAKVCSIFGIFMHQWWIYMQIENEDSVTYLCIVVTIFVQ